jgi:hypothetical protein
MNTLTVHGEHRVLHNLLRDGAHEARGCHTSCPIRHGLHDSQLMRSRQSRVSLLAARARVHKDAVLYLSARWNQLDVKSPPRSVTPTVVATRRGLRYTHLCVMVLCVHCRANQPPARLTLLMRRVDSLLSLWSDVSVSVSMTA